MNRKILEYLYPPRCPICERIFGEGICEACRERIAWVKDAYCMRCGKPLADESDEYCSDCKRRDHLFDQGRSLLLYRGEVRDSLLRMKYFDKGEYAGIYGREMARRYGAWIRSRGITHIVPVPLHKKRRRQRGYNQAEMIAAGIGEVSGLPVETKLLYRIRDVGSQKTLGLNRRFENLRGVFAARYRADGNMRVLLADDIYTTGSTADAAAEALLRAGVSKVYLLTAAIGVD